MSFYHVSQNNSGGSFDYNEEYGVTHHMVIEAENAAQAESIIEKIVDEYGDSGSCPCCGDRWDISLGDPHDADLTPQVYGRSVVGQKSASKFMEKPEICVHYADGRKEWHDFEQVDWDTLQAWRESALVTEH